MKEIQEEQFLSPDQLKEGMVVDFVCDDLSRTNLKIVGFGRAMYDRSINVVVLAKNEVVINAKVSGMTNIKLSEKSNSDADMIANFNANKNNYHPIQ